MRYLYYIFVALLLSISSLHAEEKTILYYKFDATEVSGVHELHLQEAISKLTKDQYVLVQGFGCDTGGFEASYAIAERRGEGIADEVSTHTKAQLFLARPLVITTDPKPPNRRVELRVFQTKKEWDEAIAKAEALTGSQTFGHKDIDEKSKCRWWCWLLILLVLLVLVIAFWLWLRRKKTQNHILSDDQRESLEAEVAKEIIEMKNPERKKNMATKKKTKTQTPFLRKALDKDFEDKSLGQLAKSPIHCLSGLTPRHGKLLEEAFGVKNLEDLANLKYFEIARAIVLLSKYDT